MNIIFLTLTGFESIEEHNIYSDLLREFIKHGHKITVVSPTQNGAETHRIVENNSVILRVKTGQTTNVSNLIKKGVATLRIKSIYKKEIKANMGNEHYDLILYSTPPITIDGVVKYLKTRDEAKTYLLLKDIFPQNAVDIGMMSKSGIKGLIYKYFRAREKRLYKISDWIGCMSPENVKYVINHNPEIALEKVEVCPNSIEIVDRSVDLVEREQIREKYGIPKERIVFVYGGNLGKPQDIPFIIKSIKQCQKNEKAYFLIIGDGTEYHRIEEFVRIEHPNNAKLMRQLPKEDYDKVVGACDVGLIFLDHRFTIPNFPSRLLGYMQAKIPVLACTDSNSDVGKTVVEGGFGWWCKSERSEDLIELIDAIVSLKNVLKDLGERGYDYLCDHYCVEDACGIIMNHFQ